MRERGTKGDEKGDHLSIPRCPTYDLMRRHCETRPDWLLFPLDRNICVTTRI